MECDVSIIIVNYNTSALIADCVHSILTHTVGICYEVIILDNNSEQDFKEKIILNNPGAEADNFIYIRLPENIGFGKANNEGVLKARGRNLFFLNPDTVLLNNAVGILSDFLDETENAGACGGNLFGPTLLPTFSFRRYFPGIYWETDELFNTIPSKLLFGKNRCFNNGEKPMEVGYITGADLMVKKDVFEATGGFYPGFFMYYEETDLCRRIRKSGKKIFSVPDARIQHLEGKSFGTRKYPGETKTRYIEESRKIYMKRHSGNLSRKISDFIYSAYLKSRFYLIRDAAKKSYYADRIKFFK